ncbi:hypothetical protein [Oceanobacillus locisalsi]|uniref:Uncharacterized protein n=1 Tax=Oceanobacillus locisalsi TaxID=546107 RepID=A0ABW3NIM5_9BACI
MDNLYEVNGSPQYLVQDDNGNIFYTTERSDLVKVGGTYNGSGVSYSGANLKVDGKAGESTIEALQRALGTPLDGVISGQYSNAVTQAFYGGISYGTVVP